MNWAAYIDWRASVRTNSCIVLLLGMHKRRRRTLFVCWSSSAISRSVGLGFDAVGQTAPRDIRDISDSVKTKIALFLDAESFAAVSRNMVQWSIVTHQ